LLEKSKGGFDSRRLHYPLRFIPPARLDGSAIADSDTGDLTDAKRRLRS
jgi:hypothetical protein